MTKFEIDDAYCEQFEIHQVGDKYHQRVFKPLILEDRGLKEKIKWHFDHDLIMKMMRIRSFLGAKTKRLFISGQQVFWASILSVKSDSALSTNLWRSQPLTMMR